MKSTKKGFTLVELLVAIAVGTLVLALIVTSIYFLYRIQDTGLGQSQSLYTMQNIKNYIINEYNVGDTIDSLNGKYEISNGKFIDKSLEEGKREILTCKLIPDSANNIIFKPNNDGKFIQCIITYDGGIYKFIVGAVE